MFRLILFLPILSAIAAQSGLLTRQDLSACDDPCKALSDSISAGTGDLTSLCTSTVAGNYAACYDCEVKGSGMTQADAQTAVDAFVNGCKAGGHPIAGFTISADGSAAAPSSADSGTSAATAPAASNASAPPAAKTGGAPRSSACVVRVVSGVLVLGLACAALL